MAAASVRDSKLVDAVQRLVTRDLESDGTDESFPSHPVWRRLRDIGSELWLDTGNQQQAAVQWSREFTALTTNNSLLNREVQTGAYDGLILEADRILDRFNLTGRERMLEITFVLNARHALRLVDQFDAYVSVEEHTELAHTVKEAVHYGRRYHRIHPERFIIKVPLTPAGLLTTRQLEQDDVPVNHTLGFSARQNYVVTRFAEPHFVNVFLGRLNSFVADNELGSGNNVGEKTVLASQRTVENLRDTGATTRQIGASFREGSQVARLAGLDVMTLPPGVAGDFLAPDPDPSNLRDRRGESYEPVLAEDADPETVGLTDLWEVDAGLEEAVDGLLEEDPDTADDLVDVFHAYGCGSLFPRWTTEDIRASEEEGKIPRYTSWAKRLRDGEVGLDSLMNLAGLNSFKASQSAMDTRVRDVLADASPQVG